MKKILALLICIMLAFGCFGCTAVNKLNAARDSNVGADNTSKGETPTGEPSMKLQGRYLKGDNSHIFVYDGGPVIMTTEDEHIFDDFASGDLIQIECSYIMESYPAQTDAFNIRKISNGDISDIDEQTIKMLIELGHIDEVFADICPTETDVPIETEGPPVETGIGIDLPDEREIMKGYYLSVNGEHYIVDVDYANALPMCQHPDMVDDVVLFWGYDNGDLIEIEYENGGDDTGYLRVWNSYILEEGDASNVEEILEKMSSIYCFGKKIDV